VEIHPPVSNTADCALSSPRSKADRPFDCGLRGQRDSAQGQRLFRLGGVRPPVQAMIAFRDDHREAHGAADGSPDLLLRQLSRGVWIGLHAVHRVLFHRLDHRGPHTAAPLLRAAQRRTRAYLLAGLKRPYVRSKIWAIYTLVQRD